MKTDIFTPQILQGMIQLNPMEHNNSIDETLLEKLKDKIEGKCDSFGYIKPDSARILKRSMGQCQPGQFNGNCNYKIAYSVEVCNPVEGMIIKCVVKNINKMGLFCEMADITPSPLSLILAKQHHMDDSKEAFDNVKINDVINVEIVGKKFNYNDTIISCIGKLRHDDLTLEDKLEMADSDLEVEMDLHDNSDIDNDNSEPLTSEEEETDDEDVNLEEKNPPEGVEGMVLEKDLMAEEKDVLKGLQNVPQINSEDLVESENVEHMEGVQDLESVDLVSHSQNGAPKTDIHSYQLEDEDENENENDDMGTDDLEELGEEFMGEKVSLDDLSSLNLKKVYNEDKFENMTGKPGKEVFDLEVLSHPKYKTFSKPLKNLKKCTKYLVYVQLNNMMIKYYELNEVAPKRIYLNKNHPYLEEMKKYLSAMGKSLKLAEVDETSYVH